MRTLIWLDLLDLGESLDGHNLTAQTLVNEAGSYMEKFSLTTKLVSQGFLPLTNMRMFSNGSLEKQKS